MTNGDYIRSRLTDKDLACMLGWTIRVRTESKFIQEVADVFDYWSTFEFTKNGNCAYNQKTNEINENKVSIWAWRIWHYPNGITKNRGRTDIVAKQVWLSLPYNKEYWEKAIDKVNEKYYN